MAVRDGESSQTLIMKKSMAIALSMFSQKTGMRCNVGIVNAIGTVLNTISLHTKEIWPIVTTKGIRGTFKFSK